MDPDLVSKAHENGYIESLCLGANLWMIRCCCQAFNTEDGEHRRKEFADKLDTIAGEYLYRDAERRKSNIKEKNSVVRGCFHERRNASIRPRILGSDDEYVLDTL